MKDDEGIIVTRKGFDDLTGELQQLLTVARPEIAERIRQARQVSDPSENSDYEDAKRAQALAEARIRELKTILANAKIVSNVRHDGTVRIGAVVKVQDLEDGSEDEFTMVGAAEADPSEGRVSYESSLGEAVLGKKIGEEVRVAAPGGAIRYKIVAVR